jgi:hypothetical protein
MTYHVQIPRPNQASRSQSLGVEREIVKIYGVTQSCISNLLHNRRWPHICAEMFQGAQPRDLEDSHGGALPNHALNIAGRIAFGGALGS